ncbi:MFS transporter [Simiduia sp. 21SJ11W-1]|uniref:MFS transporter n=1 Tax=Simiduia sp. 21SJ11W-1 TaxID=2909669 RepID=UPI00209CAA1E|nr:MFS transporter [Simiduia sp. 21SJ11W-1]UTA48345.1 MFS transporter [Simiduia sp. 21SJ11W-1]
MQASEVTTPTRAPRRDMWYYALGEGGTAIPLLTIGNFAMVFYTQALGLPATMAALALSITTLWDAITDPIMGHVTDNTKSRYGRRHPYLLIGGILVALSLYFVWFVPDSVLGDHGLLFTYLLLVNILLRTAVTIFVIPFTALGFEICTNYESRASLQSVRYVVNMAINFTFGAMAWTLFFKDGVNPDGSRLDGTNIVANYETMGLTIAIATLCLTLLCCYLTRHYIVDSRAMKSANAGLKAFFQSIVQIFRDPQANKVFLFYFVAQIGIGLTAQMQIYTFIDYMQLSAFQKTVVHSSTMVGFTLGSLLIVWLVKHFEKRSICTGATLFSLAMGVVMFATFGQSALRAAVADMGEWYTTVLFALPQALFWLGCGIIIPLTISMIADASEVNFHKTGELKDGSYSAIFSFVIKAATSVGILISGFTLEWLGYAEGVTTQAPETARAIANFSFLGGPIIIALALVFIWRYGINRHTLAQYKQAGSEDAAAQSNA